MDLALIFKMLWRHKLIMITSITAGIWLAVTAAGGSYTTYETSVQLMLDTPNSDLVRAGLEPGDQEGLLRIMQLVETYAVLVTSEPVLKPLRPEFESITEKIESKAFEQVPIIELTVSGRYPKRVKHLAARIVNSFQQYIQTLQNEGGVSAGNRIIVKVIAPPTPARPLSSRKLELVLLMFLGPIAVGAFLASVMENMGMGRAVSNLDPAPAVKALNDPVAPSGQ